MRLLAPLFFLLCITAHAQLHHYPVDIATLPDWMGTLVTGSKPKKSAKAEGKPLHTNAFIGTWTVETNRGRRIEYWGDAHRMVLREFTAARDLQKATLLDLQHNVKIVTSHWGGGQSSAKVEDLYIPQAGYFHDIWNDSITATGRSENILGHLCHEYWGTSNGRDSSWYWTTTAYPQLFSDMNVWASWLTQGELEHLLAFADRNAKAALRVRWGKHLYGAPSGGMEFIAITPGKVPMPELPNMAGAQLTEERLAWINNISTGRLPAWMRAFLGSLPPHSLPLDYTPPAVDRSLPDNRFIGTLTAETPTMHIGASGRDGARDTTHSVATYSYWADARRAVLILNDPDDEGYLLYAVDLDHDVVMATHNEGHSFVIPKVEITTLEEVGLKEFGRGLELDFTPQGQYRTILGRKCELYTTSERFLSHFMIPKDSVTNPVFDMRNWMVQRMGQKFKDLMFFGLADKPMPMAVMGTHLTSYKPGKAKPPVVDLSKYIVRDHRLLDQRRRDPVYEPVEEITSFDDMHIAVEPAVGPDEERVWRGNRNMVEASPDVMLTDDPDGATMPPPQRDAAKPMVEMPALEGPRVGSGTGGSSGRAELNPFMEGVMMRQTNRFVGTAVLLYSLRRNDGSTSKWTVHYASDSTRMVMVSRAEEALPNEHTRAYLLDRKAARETMYGLGADSTITPRNAELKRYFLSTLAPAWPDTVLAGTRKLLDRNCEKRLYETATTHRTSWVDSHTPSLFHDVVGARKYWGGIEIILLGGMVTGTAPGMPMEVDYTYQGGDHLFMKVIELKPGPVDPKVFEIDKNSWRQIR
ncbi:MAG: hypothetical protein KJZ58_12360 [Flavobacteriales bacterium]|nr:hypothetical protein [Flavobacteriales bacterium]